MTRAPLATLSLLLAATSLPACTLALAYPSSGGEDTYEACHDDVDEDLDGRTDCADDDCDGHCAEEDEDACANHRDDDGDSLVDGLDPQCWATAPIAVSRCASVAATHFAPSLDGTARGWSGDGVFIADPRTSGAWVMATSGTAAGLSANDASTGRVEGTSLDVDVDVPLGGRARIWLAAADARAFEVGADAIGVELVEGRPTAAVFGPTATSLLDTTRGELAAGWHHLHVELTAGTGPGLRVRVTLDGHNLGTALTCTQDEPLCVPATWVVDEALRFAWTGVPSVSGEVHVAAPTLDRPDFQPCGFADPQMSAPGRSVDLVAAARRESTVCVLATVSDPADAASSDLVSFVSHDEGVHWSGPSTVRADARTAAAIAVDGERFVGAVIVDDGHGSARSIDGLSSTDCDVWTLDEDLVPFVVSNTSSGTLDYTLGPFGEGGATVHELWLRYGANVLRMTSPDGTPGSFTTAAGGTAEIAVPHDAEIDSLTSRARRHVTRVGSDLTLVYGAGRDVRLLVRARDGEHWVGRQAALLSPSHVDGTFDATSVRRAVLVPAGEPTGSHWPALLVYTGDGGDCTLCGTIGTSTLFFGTDTVPVEATGP